METNNIRPTVETLTTTTTTTTTKTKTKARKLTVGHTCNTEGQDHLKGGMGRDKSCCSPPAGVSQQHIHIYIYIYMHVHVHWGVEWISSVLCVEKTCCGVLW